MTNKSTNGQVHRLIRPDSNQSRDYLSGCKSFLGLQFPESYLLRANHFVLVDQSSKVLGGALLVAQPGFRSLDGIPDANRNRALETVGDVRAIAEINGVWLDCCLTSPYLTFSFWCQIIERLLETEKDAFLFTFDNSNERMWQVAKSTGANILYSGFTLQLPGMENPANETIAFIDRKSLEVFQTLLLRRNHGRSTFDEVKTAQRIGSRMIKHDFSNT